MLPGKAKFIDNSGFLNIQRDAAGMRRVMVVHLWGFSGSAPGLLIYSTDPELGTPFYKEFHLC